MPELAFIADPETDILKLSRRDLPFAFSQNLTGATTVATTMLISAVRIRVCDRRHWRCASRRRGDFDIRRFARAGPSDVAVICAGPKAILNIPATLNLETLGVPVLAIAVI